MSNYKRGPWDEQLDGLMDITACCGVAHEELEVADLLDHEKDRHEEAGYRYLWAIHREPESPSVKQWAEGALNHFAEAERLETLLEAHMRNGDSQVTRSKDRALDLMPPADEQRQAAASEPEKLALSIPEAARELGVSVNTLRDLLNTGEVPGQIVLGRRKLVSRPVLTEWMSGRRNGSHGLQEDTHD